MKNYRNYLIAILTGLLVLMITTQPSNGAAKTYDAVKLVQYQACLADESGGSYGFGDYLLNLCAKYKP